MKQRVIAKLQIVTRAAVSYKSAGGDVNQIIQWAAK